MQKEVKLEVKNLYKIFGPHSKKAMKLLDEGLDKDAIFEKTETTVGVQEASFEIYKGEIFPEEFRKTLAASGSAEENK